MPGEKSTWGARRDDKETSGIEKFEIKSALKSAPGSGGGGASKIMEQKVLAVQSKQQFTAVAFIYNSAGRKGR